MALDARFLRAEEFGIRLELVGGLPLWEPYPVYKHQKAIDRIRATIEPIPELADPPSSACACIHISDVYVSFSDGSLKRPDIAIFCREPDEEDEAITLIPEAVIEVISKGYEAKDLDIGPKFYLANGVKDVVVLNPYSGEVTLFTTSQTQHFVSPVTLSLQCGCRCTV
ncbi:MAG TPA: Uma2 family endonuclease [Acidobacteriota bacterium]|nr:Uma2 family endonuclease [Acidobacteriota bacterium]HNB71348.1 Uma2 family endonuclease [Acidobacteriota bacterium]HNC43287.1 Uma2 family endonuclease [Acidobacteriota bacterium]HND19975.1 Uma2 family endonuclease [Acidobacteriota bacterium]HNG94942.1 Uma2 family endonuclease [Acidobacteriota bacterium]